MDVERSSKVRSRARVHAALGEPARLAIVDRLVVGDAAPVELGHELGMASNLLAHHLKLLEEAGLLERVRSEGDHRRRYLRLRPDALDHLVPAVPLTAPRVMFVCTHNSARSQLAAALWAQHSRVPAASAGTKPADRVHPLAVDVARRHRLPLSRRTQTAHVDDMLHGDDLVVAVCDNAHEELGDRAPDRLHWSVPDPARDPSDEVFDQVFRDIADHVDRLAPAVRHPGDSDD
ncbi:MAG TPA: ArsR family transcriptional regulator [Nocardioidaceae bacterium]|nr:ArsR family transcriptional regulator [Nocardioidaceae bacterium]